MNARDVIGRHGRTTAVAGAVLAVSAAGLMTVVATANAAPANGVCAQTVNVRHDPDINSRIVAVCDAGTKVTAAETKSGFVHLTDLGGWAAQEYVSVNGHTPAAPVDREQPSDAATGDPADDPADDSGDDAGTGSQQASTGAHRTGGSTSRGHDAPSTTAQPETPPAPAAQSDDSDDNSGTDAGSGDSGPGDQAGNGGSSDSDSAGSDDSSGSGDDSGDDSSNVHLLGS